MSKYTINFDPIDPLNTESLGQTKEESYDPFKIEKLQYYNPVYDLFHKGNLDNPISLNHPYKFQDNSTIYKAGSPKEKKERSIFTKFAPLVDPLKFLIGKYKGDYDRIRQLPTVNTSSENAHEKLNSIHNASYVDNFFCYLSGQALYHHEVLHGIEYYGSFLGIQKKYRMNIADDLDYVMQSDYFLENKGILYEIDEFDENDSSTDLFQDSSRANKGKLNIHNHTNISITSLSEDNGEPEIGDLGSDLIEINELHENELFQGNSSINKENMNIDSLSEDNREPEIVDIEPDLIEINDLTIDSTTNMHLETPIEDDSDNSEVNYSDSDEGSQDKGEEDGDEEEDEEDEDEEDEDEEDEEEEDEEDEDEEDEDEEDEEDKSSFAPDPVINAYFYDFPVQMICLEKCQGTLDELFAKKILNLETTASALFQVIMTLLIFQKMYHFTHNDLHTQNIMYIETDIEYLYYSYKKKVYRVPTYGRIFKLIDFGRAIYTFQGNLFCSDSFDIGGDGHTQYNCEPFFDETKPRIDPNYSFDLCRLGCSIYDYILDIDEELDPNTKKNPLEKTIIGWVTDDNKKNILYKKSGEERYPNFKLYKMIARTVHGKLPEDQLTNPYFAQFEYTVKKKDMKNMNIVDIDSLPTYI